LRGLAKKRSMLVIRQNDSLGWHGSDGRMLGLSMQVPISEFSVGI
jgi:hypothetical protein